MYVCVCKGRNVGWNFIRIETEIKKVAKSIPDIAPAVVGVGEGAGKFPPPPPPPPANLFFHDRSDGGAGNFFPAPICFIVIGTMGGGEGAGVNFDRGKMVSVF
jgi:hypothetical protein